MAEKEDGGAVYRDEGGKHVFYAPGETAQLAGNTSFVVKPVMDEDELQAMVIASAMQSLAELSKIGEQKDKAPSDKIEPQNAQSEKSSSPGETSTPREKPPLWFTILFFGLPLAAIGGIIYLITRLFRRRRGAEELAAS